MHEQRLSAVLSEFARTMVTDFPIQAILDRLVERIVQVLPVTAAGVTVISPGHTPHYVAASSAGAMRLEELQSGLGEGPCVVAYQTGELVSVPDLRSDGRFSAFCSVASAVGLVAVFAVPMRHNDGRLGALDLFRATPGPLSEADLTAAQTLADVAAAYLLNAQRREEARRGSELLRVSSLHDPLTGLANRVLLQQRLQHAALRAHRSHTDAAVLFADLDNFKQINDRHGHFVGDALLVAVARRLGALLRPGDTLARVSGDEFVILCEDITAPADIEVLAARIGQALSEPFPLPDGHGGVVQCAITASVGLAFSGRAEDIGDQLVRDADTAMYQAKRKGGGAHQVIDLREARQARDRAELQADLSAAYTQDKLDVAYQPIVRASDGLVTGVEALLRWSHPARGPIPTLSMVDVAEQNLLILEVGRWVLQRSCTDRMRWAALQPDQALDLAVNVSIRQLEGPGFSDTVADVLASTGMDPAALTLEMTEGIFLADSTNTMTVLEDLKNLGVRLALDDFGTGYSSLSYLRRFPVDIVKIDQGFVADIGRDPVGGAIIAAVTNLAHVLGLSVTAEGVETEQQRDGVIDLGCDSAQGFHYARPTTADRITGQLQTSSRTRPLHLPDAHPRR